MNELTSIGLILLFALLAGHLVKVLRIPEVTGYILAGVALGPSMLGWLSQENLVALGVLSEVALGLILFSVGSVFEFSRFLKFGRQVILITLVESALAAVAVTAGDTTYAIAVRELELDCMPIHPCQQHFVADKQTQDGSPPPS